MNTREETLLEYGKVISGEKLKLSATFFKPSHRREKVIILTRHLVEDILHIAPEKAIFVLDKDVLSEYKLSNLLLYVERPIEYGPDEVKQLIYHAYPEMKEDIKPLIIGVYKEILSKKRARFPQDYFRRGDISKYRAQILIEHLCIEILGIKNREELEKAFFPQSKGLETLKDYSLLPIHIARVFPVYDQLFEHIYIGEEIPNEKK